MRVRQTLDREPNGLVRTAAMSDNFYQHSTLCACGKSFWAVDGWCNKCGVPRERMEPIGVSMLDKKSNAARAWDKKRHKYLPIAKGGLRHG